VISVGMVLVLFTVDRNNVTTRQSNHSPTVHILQDYVAKSLYLENYTVHYE